MKTKPRFLSACAALALAVAGCGPSAGTTPQHVVNASGNVLQLAVGTANIYGTLTGLNVVSTYRQPKGGQRAGDSGALTDSPVLTVPGGFGAPAGSPGALDPDSTVLTGPAPSEIPSGTTAGSMTASPQTPGNASVTTFGQSGGAFGLGIEPFNYTFNGIPWAVAPYPVPLYDATSPDPNQVPASWGGVPAFDILGTGQAPNGSGVVPAGTAGISEGLDVFEGVIPVANSPYALTVTVRGSSGTFTKTATATMTTTAPLPNIAAPAFTPDATGNGGAFAIALPPGVTEGYIQIVDFGTSTTSGTPPAQVPNCNGASAGSPIYYTFAVTTSGTSTLSDAAGPGGAPTICTAAQNTAANGGSASAVDVVGAWSIGFDYPAYESSYPNSNGNPAPAITGASGQSDITISSVALYPAGSSIPAFRRRSFSGRR